MIILCVTKKMMMVLMVMMLALALVTAMLPTGYDFFRILYRGNGSFSRVAIMLLLLLYHCFRCCHVLFLSFATVVSRLRSVFGR